MALTRLGLNQSVNLASNVTGTLPTGNGGTGATSFAPGKVLQVKYAYGNTTQSLNAVNNQDITSLSIAITPASTSSKFLLSTVIQAKFTDNSGFGTSFVKTVGGSSSVIFTDVSTSAMYLNSSDTSIDSRGRFFLQFLDSPSTTSEITYKVQVDVDNSVTFQHAGNLSTFSVMEIES